MKNSIRRCFIVAMFMILPISHVFSQGIESAFWTFLTASLIGDNVEITIRASNFGNFDGKLQFAYSLDAIPFDTTLVESVSYSTETLWEGRYIGGSFDTTFLRSYPLGIGHRITTTVTLSRSHVTQERPPEMATYDLSARRLADEMISSPGSYIQLERVEVAKLLRQGGYTRRNLDSLQQRDPSLARRMERLFMGPSEK